MIMKIVEYKRHIIDGVIKDPDFILDGGVFPNPADNTWVGKVAAEADRTYYVPDSLVELSRDDLIARQTSINNEYPAHKKSDESDPHSVSVPLTSNELIAQIDSWILGA